MQNTRSLKANFKSFKRSLRALDKRDIEFIKGGEVPAPHDQIRVTHLRKGEKIKDRSLSLTKSELVTPKARKSA